MGLTYDPDVLPAIRSLPPDAKKAVRAALDILANDHFSSRLDIRRLEAGGNPKYRVVVGAYRIAFVVLERETRVMRVFHRRDGYGWLERLG